MHFLFSKLYLEVKVISSINRSPLFDIQMTTCINVFAHVYIPALQNFFSLGVTGGVLTVRPPFYESWQVVTSRSLPPRGAAQCSGDSSRERGPIWRRPTHSRPLRWGSGLGLRLLPALTARASQHSEAWSTCSIHKWTQVSTHWSCYPHPRYQAPFSFRVRAPCIPTLCHLHVWCLMYDVR